MAILSPDTKRLLRKIDFELLIPALCIIIYSLVIISSATHVNTPSEERFWFVQRQGIFAAINIILAIFFMNFDYRGLQPYGNKLYIFNIIMLLAVMLFGHAALGAQRWIQIGPISLQPSINIRRSRWQSKYIARIIADCCLCRITVHFGLKATRLRNFISVYGNILWYDFCLWN